MSRSAQTDKRHGQPVQGATWYHASPEFCVQLTRDRVKKYNVVVHNPYEYIGDLGRGGSITDPFVITAGNKTQAFIEGKEREDIERKKTQLIQLITQGFGIQETTAATVIEKLGRIHTPDFFVTDVSLVQKRGDETTLWEMFSDLASLPARLAPKSAINIKLTYEPSTQLITATATVPLCFEYQMQKINLGYITQTSTLDTKTDPMDFKIVDYATTSKAYGAFLRADPNSRQAEQTLLHDIFVEQQTSNPEWKINSDHYLLLINHAIKYRLPLNFQELNLSSDTINFQAIFVDQDNQVSLNKDDAGIFKGAKLNKDQVLFLLKNNLQALLQGVDLRNVDLRGVDLRGVDLRGVDLRGVDLRGADLREAIFDDMTKFDKETKLAGAQLGLEQVRQLMLNENSNLINWHGVILDTEAFRFFQDGFTQPTQVQTFHSILRTVRLDNTILTAGDILFLVQKDLKHLVKGATLVDTAAFDQCVKDKIKLTRVTLPETVAVDFDLDRKKYKTFKEAKLDGAKLPDPITFEIKDSKSNQIASLAASLAELYNKFIELYDDLLKLKKRNVSSWLKGLRKDTDKSDSEKLALILKCAEQEPESRTALALKQAMYALYCQQELNNDADDRVVHANATNLHKHFNLNDDVGLQLPINMPHVFPRLKKPSAEDGAHTHAERRAQSASAAPVAEHRASSAVIDLLTVMPRGEISKNQGYFNHCKNQLKEQMGYSIIGRQGALDALFALADKLNADKSEKEKIKIDLSNMNLSGVIFHGRKLDGVILRNCNLSRADFTNCDFTGCDARDAKFDGARMDNVTICYGGSSKQETRLEGASLKGVTASEGAKIKLVDGADLENPTELDMRALNTGIDDGYQAEFKDTWAEAARLTGGFIEKTNAKAGGFCEQLFLKLQHADTVRTRTVDDVLHGKDGKHDSRTFRAIVDFVRQNRSASDYTDTPTFGVLGEASVGTGQQTVVQRPGTPNAPNTFFVENRHSRTNSAISEEEEPVYMQNGPKNTSFTNLAAAAAATDDNHSNESAHSHRSGGGTPAVLEFEGLIEIMLSNTQQSASFSHTTITGDVDEAINNAVEKILKEQAASAQAGERMPTKAEVEGELIRRILACEFAGCDVSGANFTNRVGLLSELYAKHSDGSNDEQGRYKDMVISEPQSSAIEAYSNIVSLQETATAEKLAAAEEAGNAKLNPPTSPPHP